MHAGIHIYIYIYTHACIHTYMHTYICIYNCWYNTHRCPNDHVLRPFKHSEVHTLVENRSPSCGGSLTVDDINVLGFRV